MPKSLSNSEEKEPNWEQVFHVNALDFHSKQSDAVMETCRKAGNIIMLKKEVMPVVQALINQLHTTKATRFILTPHSIFILNVLACAGVQQFAAFNLTFHACAVIST